MSPQSSASADCDDKQVGERDREANPAHDTNKLPSIFLFENGEYRVFPLVEHLMRSALFL